MPDNQAVDDGVTEMSNSVCSKVSKELEKEVARAKASLQKAIDRVMT